MGTKTTNYEFNLPANDDYADQNKFNENFVSLDTILKGLADAIAAAAAGIHYQGAVNYYSNLPANPERGDAYTVLYAGSSGTESDGTEYVWDMKGGTLQWIDFSKDSYTKAQTDALLALKQTLLSATNKLNPDYIAYDSSHRAVSDSEKTTWNGKIDTNGTGLSKNGTTLNHSNSTTAQSTQAFRQVAYDAQGHITGSTAATTAQAAAINSGITSTDVAQINTNKSNILLVEQMAATKNKLDLAKAASVTVPDNVTYVTNSDKSITITVNGITSAKSLYFNDLPNISGEIVLSGIPSDGGFSTYMADLQQNGTTIDNMSDQGSGSEPVTMASGVFTYRIRLAAGTYTFTVKPMIVSSTIWSAGFTDYTQYAPTNAELYQMILNP